MSFQIQRPSCVPDELPEDILKEIVKTDPLWNLNEEYLLSKILSDSLDEELALDLCRNILNIKPKGMNQKHLERVRRKFDELKSNLAKKTKEDFKKTVKELCNVDVFQDEVCMHLPKPMNKEIKTALHQDVERMLGYIARRNEMIDGLRKEIKSMKEQEDRKGSNSERARRRRALRYRTGALIRSLKDVNAGMAQIENVLKSQSGPSKVDYAYVVASRFSNIKDKLLAIVEKSKQLELDVKEYIKEGKRTIESTPDYIDEVCDICIVKEKENNFLRDFRNSVVKKPIEKKGVTVTKRDCMVCGVTLKRCSI
ncbi:uncharacterized protein [Halyomorpha halys]|uniref:uncharacterized protein isoform X2 n=1 Tax=Halyomorpha halys TaxID=286706 RepID=UPI0006D5215B|nr:uncharacterized protein LOC106690145 isoform X2 [Halyomorpha halys]